MNKWIVSALIALLLTGGGLVMGFRGSRREAPAGDDREFKAQVKSELAELGQRFGGLAAKLDALGGAIKARPQEPGAPPGSAEARDDATKKILSELEALRRLLENLGTAAPPPPVETDFKSSEGYALADSFLEQGKFATAANGYLTFLKQNPGHPDALEILKKARDAFQKAGYGPRAIELQKEILANYPVDDRFRELMTLANLEKEGKKYQDAIGHVEEACAAASHLEEKLWGMGFRAWYIELQQGPEAGLRAYEEAEQHAVALGLGESNPARSNRQKIERLEKILDASRGRR